MPSLSRSPAPLASSSLLQHTLSTMCSIPAPPYDIHPNDFIHHQSFMAPFDGSFDMGPEEAFNPLPFDAGFAPLFPKPESVSYNQFQVPDGGPGAPPAFQTYHAPAFPQSFQQLPPSFTRTASSSSESSLGHTWNPSPDSSSFGNIPQLYPELESNPVPVPPVAAPPAKSKRVTTVRRSRGPNRRPPGTRFADLMENLPVEVQTALTKSYDGCCSDINDNSTRQKHIFSKGHCGRLPKRLQEVLPSFVCPAFIALHGQCKSAKAGRYDSTERHCKNCPGYQEINSNLNVFPVQVTNREHQAIQEFRTNAKRDEETVLQVQNCLRKVLVMMIEAGMTLQPEPDASDEMDVTAESMSVPMADVGQPSFLETEGDDGDDMLYF